MSAGRPDPSVYIAGRPDSSPAITGATTVGLGQGSDNDYGGDGGGDRWIRDQLLIIFVSIFYFPMKAA